MELFQTILVYLTLAIALGYLIKKFLIPKRLLNSKKKIGNSCGEDDCSCH